MKETLKDLRIKTIVQCEAISLCDTAEPIQNATAEKIIDGLEYQIYHAKLLAVINFEKVLALSLERSNFVPDNVGIDFLVFYNGSVKYPSLHYTVQKGSVKAMSNEMIRQMNSIDLLWVEIFITLFRFYKN